MNGLCFIGGQRVDTMPREELIYWAIRGARYDSFGHDKLWRTDRWKRKIAEGMSSVGADMHKRKIAAYLGR